MKIENKILVMSGKGGVGKTTVAVNLACSLAEKGYQVGILDVDIHGPNVPKMLNLKDKELKSKNNLIQPIHFKDNLKVMSMAFLLAEDSDAVIWRGPMKHKVIKQFAEEVDWGELDYLVVDLPPGTGDEPMSIAQVINPVTGSIIVSTPQEVALLDARKSATFSKKIGVPIIGIVENMSGSIFGSGGAEKASEELDTPFLGKVSMDETIVKAGDAGIPFCLDNNRPKEEFNKIVEKVIEFCR